MTTVKQALEQINKSLNEVKAVTDTPFKTPCIINGVSGRLDIRECKEEKVLVEAYASIKVRATAITEAYEELGYTTYPQVKVDGATLEEWKDDIKLKLSIINQHEYLKSLNEMKKELEELLSKEEKQQIVLEKYSSLLSVNKQITE